MESKESTATENLTRRERLVLRGLMSELCATDALLLAGYSESVARTRQRDVLGKPRMKEAIHSTLQSQGLTVERLAETLREGLEATKTTLSH